MEAPPKPAHAAQELFREHGAAVYRFAMALLRHHQDAEDVVQETFLKLLRHLGAGGSTENIRGWLFTVAAHALRDRQRRRSRWIPWGSDHEGIVGPPRLLDEDGRIGKLREALQGLPARDRLLLALRAQGLSYLEIAAAAGIRVSSVGRLLARAVARCAHACAESRAVDKTAVTEEVDKIDVIEDVDKTRAIKPERHGIL